MIRTKFTDLNFQDNYARQCLAYGGGKAGFARFAKQKLPKVAEYIPDGEFIDAASASDPAKLENFLKSIESSNSEKILRGCTSFVEGYSSGEQEAINDFCGVVDVLDTIQTHSKKYVLLNAPIILDRARTNEVKSHLKWETEIEFDGNIGLLVQDYKESDTGGYVIQHPSNEGTFIIETEKKSWDSVVSSVITDKSRHTDYLADKEVDILVDLYKEIKDSGLIPKEYTFQIEYCIDEQYRLWILQIRLFRKKEESANFAIPNDLDFYSAHYKSFGVTPKEGEPLVLAHLNSEKINSLKDREKVAYSLRSEFHVSPPLEFQPKNIFAFIAESTNQAFLGHGYTRFMMKSELGMLVKKISDDIGVRRIRVFSNGIYGGYVEE